VILLCYTSAFSEVIYADFYAKILDWNFRLVNENSQILVVVFVSKLNFSFSFRFVDENCRIFVVVVVIVFVTKINLFSSTKIFVFVVVDEKTLVENSWYFGSECCETKAELGFGQAVTCPCTAGVIDLLLCVQWRQHIDCCWAVERQWQCDTAVCCHYELMQSLVACSRLSLLSLMPSCISVCV